MIINKPPEKLPANVDRDIKYLIDAMLNKEASRRPSIWDLAQWKCIKEKIDKFIDETDCRDSFESYFTGPTKKEK